MGVSESECVCAKLNCICLSLSRSLYMCVHVSLSLSVCVPVALSIFLSVSLSRLHFKVLTLRASESCHSCTADKKSEKELTFVTILGNHLSVIGY